MSSRIEIFHVDAFTDKIFHGNPAAVCLVEDWLNDELMQAIAIENNLSETAFVRAVKGKFSIRWFAPNGEVTLCGHATLAAGFVLNELGKCQGEVVDFVSRSGHLQVHKKGQRYTLDFPRLTYLPSQISDEIINIVDQPVLEVYDSELDYIAVLASEEHVAKARINANALLHLDKRGLVLTAVGENSDFYSRGFYPKLNIQEDPVTGSAHCVLAPFWADRLNKTTLHAIQGSIRKGELFCKVLPERVLIGGYCRWYFRGHLVI